jgi:hypothetical protein
MKQMTALTILKSYGILLASYDLFDSYPIVSPPTPQRVFWTKADATKVERCLLDGR